MHAVDTSVAVPLLLTTHPQHEQVQDWAKDRSLSLGPRATLETYAVLTRLPGSNRLRAEDAVALLDENFDLGAQAPTPGVTLPTTLAMARISGGASYDAVIALEAVTAALPLASRDRRAQETYRRMGASVDPLD